MEENIDIDKGILQNIDIDKILYRFKFGISSSTSTARAVLKTMHIGRNAQNLKKSLACGSIYYYNSTLTL